MANLNKPTPCLTPATARCEPATERQGTGELLACLTLVAPSGLTAEDRSAWVAVARKTLSGIPADLLARGCKAARETCRFPSEIVPAILGEVKLAWDRRKRDEAWERARHENRNAPRLTVVEPDCVDPAEVRALINGLERDLAA